ncbi:MAG: glycosyltransferase family protein, partial [Planctomycetota bacterium]
MTHTPAGGAGERTPCRAAAAAARRVDGIVCFGGEDWWYHNRGHYDMQMMRQAARRLPVLYVNSIGMRVPRPGRKGMFGRRLQRKLASLRRGLVRVDERFSVFSPLALPGRSGRRVTARVLPPQVRAAARRLGINRPLVWVACPPAAASVDALDPAAVVYQRTDRYECFPGVNASWIGACDEAMKARADLTVFCSSRLARAEGARCRHAAYVDHGADVDRFIAAGRGEAPEPEAFGGLSRPRVGFIGGIDAHTFDPVLFTEVARALPEISFVLVGGCSLPAG